jgi:hypothetical protein
MTSERTITSIYYCCACCGYCAKHCLCDKYCDIGEIEVSVIPCLACEKEQGDE